jgi:methionyl aminopeptidase
MARASTDLVEVFLALREDWVRPGVRTRDLDVKVEEMVLGQGNLPAFRGYQGFPASSCISINEEVVHGMPGDREILEGDIVGIDIGLVKDGWFADSAETFCIGEVRPEVAKLCESCAAGLAAGIAAARPGNHLMDIGRAIQSRGREDGFGIVETLVGHGIGRQLHEAPKVPNYECFTLPNPFLEVGMVLALEPMFTLGGSRVRVLPDGWTVVTSDGSLAAHYEHTVAITEDGPVVMTAR